jgi:hypothetical protein
MREHLFAPLFTLESIASLSLYRATGAHFAVPTLLFALCPFQGLSFASLMEYQQSIQKLFSFVPNSRY